MSHEPQAAPRSAIAAAIAVMCLVWGTTWFVLQEGLADLPPFGSAGVRFAIAWCAMALLAPVIARREGGSRPRIGLVLASGGFNFACSYGIVYWSEQHIPSAFAAVMFAVYPLMMGVIGHFFVPGERLVGRQWGGLLLAFGGVAALFATDLRGPEVGEIGLFVGAVFLLSPLVSACGTAVVKRYGRDVSSALHNRDAMFVGAVLLLVASLVFEGDATWNWTPRAVAGIVYLALVGTVLTFGLYFWALRHARASTLSVIAYVNPLVAVLIGGLVGAEPITVWTLSGLAGILLGVALALRGGR